LPHLVGGLDESNSGTNSGDTVINAILIRPGGSSDSADIIMGGSTDA
jgi:hypothetical protein